MKRTAMKVTGSAPRIHVRIATSSSLSAAHLANARAVETAPVVRACVLETHVPPYRKTTKTVAVATPSGTTRAMSKEVALTPVTPVSRVLTQGRQHRVRRRQRTTIRTALADIRTGTIPVMCEEVALTPVMHVSLA